MAREVGTDARARKRERDKQNQRQRRRRERDAFEELQRKNELLEQQVKALRGGNSNDVQSLSDTVQHLEKSNKELKERLETVDHFVKTWSALFPLSTTSGANGTSTSNPPQNGVSIALSQVSSPAGSTPLVTCRYLTLFELDQSTELSPASNNIVSATEYFPGRRAISIPSDWSGSITSPVVERAEASKPEIRVAEHRLQRILSLPVWERLPLNLNSSGKTFQPSFDPFGGISERLRKSPESLRTCSPYPSPMDLLYGESTNELASWIASVTYPNPSRRTEKLAYQWYTYMIARVSGVFILPHAMINEY
jgi:hypothetical protein